jgi:hypothetical protein
MGVLAQAHSLARWSAGRSEECPERRRRHAQPAGSPPDCTRLHKNMTWRGAAKNKRPDTTCPTPPTSLLPHTKHAEAPSESLVDRFPGPVPCCDRKLPPPLIRRSARPLIAQSRASGSLTTIALCTCNSRRSHPNKPCIPAAIHHQTWPPHLHSALWRPCPACPGPPAASVHRQQQLSPAMAFNNRSSTSLPQPVPLQPPP